jgi:hypothetical protein
VLDKERGNPKWLLNDLGELNVFLYLLRKKDSINFNVVFPKLPVMPMNIPLDLVRWYFAIFIKKFNVE